MRPPAIVLRKIVRYSLRKKDVPSIGACHHSLGHVDTSPSEIYPIVNVFNFIDRATMNSHSKRNLWRALQRLAYLQRATDRSFRVIKENKGHSVTRRQANQFIRSFCTTELICIVYDFI